jgi:proteic killer suppression protein
VQYYCFVIASFKNQDVENLFNGIRVARFVNIEVVAMRKLAMLNRVPPNNRLEALKGNRQGQYSIRVNDQWRICFHFENGHAYDVEIVDYH